MADIFLAYASDEVERAKQLSAVLAHYGYSVFWDRNIEPGQVWEEVIERELDAAGAVVVLWTKASASSDWVRAEAEVGLERDVLIPVRFENVQVPLQFRTIQSNDLVGWDGDPSDSRLADLIQWVEHLVGSRSPTTPEADAPTARPPSRGEPTRRVEEPTPAYTPQHKIFLSYRRYDSAYATGHLSEYLTKAFGKDEVYKDVDSMPLGADVRQHLDDAVANCRVLLAVIGRDWLDAEDDRGNRRLDNEQDHLRIEIESALKRAIPVVPILLGAVEIPPADSLPEGLRQLAYLNGIKVRPDPDFQNDVARLVQGLEVQL